MNYHQEKKFTDSCSYGKEAMMFLGDHWIGTEPYGKYFRLHRAGRVVGSVGSGVTLRMISDIKGVKYTEGRLLPYFFPDVFTEGGDPIGEARTNWMRPAARSCAAAGPHRLRRLLKTRQQLARLYRRNSECGRRVPPDPRKYAGHKVLRGPVQGGHPQLLGRPA